MALRSWPTAYIVVLWLFAPPLLFLLGAGALVAVAVSPPRPSPDGLVAHAVVNGWALLGVTVIAVSVPALLTRRWRRLRAQVAGHDAAA